MAPLSYSLALVALLALSSASSASAASVPGIATEFGGAADKQSRDAASLGLLDGACGFGNMSRGDFPAWKAAALSPNSVLLAGSSLSNKLGCGICVTIACDQSRQLPFSPCKAGSLPVTVMVVVSFVLRLTAASAALFRKHASAFVALLAKHVKTLADVHKLAVEAGADDAAAYASRVAPAAVLRSALRQAGEGSESARVIEDAMEELGCKV